MVSFDKGPPAALAQHFARAARHRAGVPDVLLVRLGPGLLPRPAHRQGAAPRDRLRPGSDRARRRPHPRRRRRPAGAGLPRQARPDPQLRAGQRLPGRGAPAQVCPGPAAALRPGPAEVAQPVLRPGHRPRARGDRRLRRQRARSRSTSGTTKPDVPIFKVPHPSNPDTDLLLRDVAYGDPGPARGRHPGRGRVGHGGTQLRHDVRGVRLPARSRPRTCPSGCRPGWATTPGAGGPSLGTTTRSSGDSKDLDHTLVWQAPTPEDLEVLPERRHQQRAPSSARSARPCRSRSPATGR